MANITQELRRAIQNQLADRYLNEHRREIFQDLEPLPTTNELTSLINNAPEYRCTTNFEHLEMTNEVLVMTPEHRESVKIPVYPAVPVIRAKSITIGEWVLEECHSGLSLVPTNTSERHARQEKLMGQCYTYKGYVNRTIASISTLAQFVKELPEWKDLECIVDAQTREKTARKNAAENRRNAKPLERVEIPADSNLAIAKARLLGAKYVT